MTVGAGMALPLTTSELDRLNQAVKGLEESLVAANQELETRKAALVATGAALKRVGEVAADSAGAEDRGMELRAIGADDQDALVERAVPLVLGELDDLAFLRRRIHDLEGSHSDALADLAAEREECAELEASLGKTSALLAAAEVSDLPLYPLNGFRVAVSSSLHGRAPHQIQIPLLPRLSLPNCSRRNGFENFSCRRKYLHFHPSESYPRTCKRSSSLSRMLGSSLFLPTSALKTSVRELLQWSRADGTKCSARLQQTG